MKKILSLIMVLLISSLTFVPVSFASEEETASYKLDRLRAFDILDYELDTQSPISRADFTVLLAKAGNIPPMGENLFEDVSDDDGRAGYLTAAKTAGITNGYGNGTFMPDRNITLVEAVKMSLSLLGYDKIINLSNESECLSRAGSLKLLDGVAISDGNTLTGGNAAVLINNLLDSKKYVLFSSNGTYTLNTGEKTAAEEFLGLYRFQGEVLEVNKDKNRVLLRNTDDNSQKYYTLGEQTDIDYVFGTQYYYADLKTDTIVYVDMDNSGIIYDYIEGINKNFDGGYFDISSIDSVTFKNTGKYKADKNIEIYVNGEKNLMGIVKLIDCFAKAITENDVITKLEVYTLTEGGLIYRADPDTLKYSDRVWADNVMSGFKNTENLDIIIDGTPGHIMTDLKSDMVFDYYQDEDSFMIVASSRKAVGVFDGYSKNELTVEGEKLDISDKYGVLVYSVYYQKYIDDNDYSRLLNKKIYAFIDDNKQVRFIRDYVVSESENTFVGLITGYKEKAFENYLEVYKLSASTEDAVLLKVKSKLPASSLSYDYAKNTAKAYDGSNLFKITVNSESTITKIEHVEYFGNRFRQKYSLSDFSSSKTMRNIYCGDAVMFAVFDDPDTGEYTIRIVDASYMNNSISDNANGVEVISDFDMANNPVPNYVMFGDGSAQMHYNATRMDVIKSVVYIEDDMAQITLCDGSKYKVTKKYAESNGLDEKTVISYNTNHLGKNAISVISKRDVSGEPDTWSYDQYSLDAGEGFYRGENVILRNGTTIQFTIDGSPSNVYMLYNMWDGSTAKIVGYRDGVFEAPQRYLTGYQNKTKSRSYMKSTLSAIQRNDRAWFHLTSDGFVDFILYEGSNYVD